VQRDVRGTVRSRPVEQPQFEGPEAPGRPGGLPMEITMNEEKDRVRVRLRGDLYVEQGEELMQVFDRIVEKKPLEVVIDLSDLNSITSSGIGKIVLLYKELQKQGGTIKIVGVNQTIMQIFKIVKLDKLMHIETT
jgi:anti-sigma B factor antagonist